MAPPFCFLALIAAAGGCARPEPAAAPPLIEPPFVRKWTAQTGEQTRVLGVRDGTAYYGSSQGAGAVVIATGKTRWSTMAGRTVTMGALSSGALVVVAQAEKQADIVTLNIASGAPRPLLKLQSQVIAFAVAGRTVYVVDRLCRILALEATTGAVRWRRELRAPLHRVFGSSRLAASERGIYVAVDNTDWSLDPSDGRVLWKRPSWYASLYAPILIGSDVVTQAKTCRRTELRTGRVVWTRPGSHGDLQQNGGVLVGMDESRRLAGWDAATGRAKWTLPLKDRNSSYSDDDARTIGNGERIWVLRNPVLCVTQDGRQVWAKDRPFTGSPVFADAESLVTVDQSRILGYVAGSLPAAPTAQTARKALAEDLVARYEDLDDAEKARLATLTPWVFRPFLARWAAWAREYDQPGERGKYELYCRLEHSKELLRRTCARADTSAVLAAIDTLSARSPWRPDLERLLQEKGEQALYIPGMVARLRAAPRPSNGTCPASERGLGAVLSAVAASSHPEAVRLMIEVLQDPKAPGGWRAEAFRHLAGTGGAAGARAVLAARARRAPRKAWYETVRVPGKPGWDLVDVATDARGRTWALFHSGALGNASDLFIARKTPAGWGRPLFTPIFTERTWDLEPTKSYRGVPVSRLVRKAWAKMLTSDASLTRDTDGDGLTDLVEARFGTNPRKADTDGDGYSDAVDPCPNAAPRTMGDDEKIIAACVEARFFQEGRDAPATISAGSVRPFELYGYDGTLLWETAARRSPLGKVYGGGMESLYISGPDAARKPTIVYGPGRRTARTTISRQSGGLNGDGYEVRLKKIGDDWFVVGMRMTYIS